jgi:ABC-2 type transport system permease protein
LKITGGIFETVGYALPFAPAVDVARSILAGGELSDVSVSIYMILIYAVTLFVLAIVLFRWRIKRG